MLKLQLGMASLCLFTIIVLSASSELSAQQITPRTIAELSPVMRESSGIATTGKGGFWTINDGTNGAKLHASDTTGNVYRTINLLNGNNYDWEDMTTDPDGNIYIADIGDKNAAYSPSQAYDDLSIYKVPNPDYFCEDNVLPEVINLRFPNSNVDNAESIFYHDNFIYIITKSDATGSEIYAGKAVLYRVPATPNTLQQQYVAQYIDEIDISPTGVAKDYYQVSSAALSPDGKLLVLVGEVRLWIIQNFTEGIFFDGQITTYDFPNRLQRESVDFVGNREIYITDEDEQLQSSEDGLLAYINLCPYLNEENGCPQNFGVARSQADTYFNSAVEFSNGLVSNTGLSVSMGNNQKTGLRFEDINIPYGAKITRAHIQFRANTSSSAYNNMTIYGEANNNPASFNSLYRNISNRAKTHQSVSWSFGAWMSGDAKNVQRTPDISKVIQEIISDENWNNYDALAFIVEGTGSRIAKSESGCARSAPELIIEYYEPLKMNLRAFLEGPYNPETNRMETNLNILNVLPGQNAIPVGQPYSATTWEYEGDEGNYYPDGNYPSNIVDWVLISLRSTSDPSSTIARTAALIDASGSIKQIIPFELSAATRGDFYVLIQHRNHLPAMSSTRVSIADGVISYDFTTKNTFGSTPAQPAQKRLEPGVWGLYTGDSDKLSDIGGYDITGADKIIFQVNNGEFYVYLPADFNMDGDVTGADKGLWLANNGVFSLIPK